MYAGIEMGNHKFPHDEQIEQHLCVPSLFGINSGKSKPQKKIPQASSISPAFHSTILLLLLLLLH
jgi:hypothetical protein